MTGNAQKTWFGATQNEFASRKIADAIQVLGKALPATVTAVNGAIVTVNFDVDAAPFTLPQVEMPVETSIYNRPPIQVGDKGWVKSADVFLGANTGLGSGTPKLVSPANLAALVWAPLGNATWAASPDANAYLLQGPNGFILRNLDNTYSIVGNSDGITITDAHSNTIAMTSDGISLTSHGNVLVVGSAGLTINGVDIGDTHKHSGVTTGSGDTGPPV
jgi:hypothetical protein